MSKMRAPQSITKVTLIATAFLLLLAAGAIEQPATPSQPSTMAQQEQMSAVQESEPGEQQASTQQPEQSQQQAPAAAATNGTAKAEEQEHLQTMNQNIKLNPIASEEDTSKEEGAELGQALQWNHNAANKNQKKERGQQQQQQQQGGAADAGQRVKAANGNQAQEEASSQVQQGQKTKSNNNGEQQKEASKTQQKETGTTLSSKEKRKERIIERRIKKATEDVRKGLQDVIVVQRRTVSSAAQQEANATELAKVSPYIGGQGRRSTAPHAGNKTWSKTKVPEESDEAVQKAIQDDIDGGETKPQNQKANEIQEQAKKLTTKQAQADAGEKASEAEGEASDSKATALHCKTNIERLDKGPENWRAVIGTGVAYEDPDFVPGKNALYWTNHLRPGSAEAVKAYKSIKGWVRPRQLLQPDQKLSLWGEGGISVDAVSQGKLGDGWFLSAATALAAVPKRVKKLFVLDKYPGEGIFAVKFFHKGAPIIITIDDRIPVMDNNWPVNARPAPNGAWWVVLLEKAYAKMNLNYANLEGGMQYEAMRALTGQPVVLYQTSNKSESDIWGSLSKAVGKGYIITASCLQDYAGLEGGKAYVVLGLQELKDPKDQSVVEQLIKVRPSYGFVDYSGNWNVNSKAWTEDFANQVGLRKLDSSTFFMTVADFADAFANYDVTYYHDDWQTSSATMADNGRKWIFPFSLIRQMEVFLTIDTDTLRTWPPNCKRGEAKEYNILLRNMNGEIMDQEPVSVRSGYGVIHKERLPAGNYQLIVVNFGDTVKDQEFTVTTYAENKVEILEQKQALAQILSRAQLATPQDVITTKLSAADPQGRQLQTIGQSFLDETTQTLYVGVSRKNPSTLMENKDSNQTHERPENKDLKVDIELMTVGSEFPFVGVQSNVEDWRQGANLSQVVRIADAGPPKQGDEQKTTSSEVQDRFFRLQLSCPKLKEECYFAIPQVLQAKKVKYEQN